MVNFVDQEQLYINYLCSPSPVDTLTQIYLYNRLGDLRLRVNDDLAIGFYNQSLQRNVKGYGCLNPQERLASLYGKTIVYYRLQEWDQVLNLCGQIMTLNDQDDWALDVIERVREFLLGYPMFQSSQELSTIEEVLAILP